MPPTDDTVSPKRRGRPRKPAVKRNRDGSVSVRTTIDVGGVSVRKQINTQQPDKTVARVMGKVAAAGGNIEVLKSRGQTFEQHARRIVGASTIKSKKTRLQRLTDYAFPEIGGMAAEAVLVPHIKACLERCAEAQGGRWTQTVRHLKNDISAVLGTLFEEHVVAENVALRISFRRKNNSLGGKRIVSTILPRTLLTDEEVEALIAHLLDEGGGTLGELGMLCLCARMLGGMRTSDLHAWRWDHIDIVHWLTAQVPRPKTMGQEEDSADYRLEDYALDRPGIRELVPHLIAWWQKNGRRTEGPVFPVRRGKRYGEHKLPGTSYARELRNALWRAGVARPLPGFALAQTDEGRRALCALQVGMKGKKSCVDFHSFRRAFVTATVNTPGLSFGESQRLADHSDPRTHGRYVDKGGQRVIPETAVPKVPAPRISAPPVAKSQPLQSNFSNDYGRVRRDSNSRPTASEAKGRPSPGVSSDVFEARDDVSARQQTTRRQNSAPEIPASDPLASAIESAVKQGQFDLAKQLVELAERRAEPAGANVVPLRKRQ